MFGILFSFIVLFFLKLMLWGLIFIVIILLIVIELIVELIGIVNVRYKLIMRLYKKLMEIWLDDK